MHMDGAALFAAANEINNSIQNGRVERIAQPTRFEIVFTIRAERNNTRLLISADPEAARLHLCGPADKGPDKPFPFLMLLRKYLLHARLLEVRVPKMERVCHLHFLATDELGDKRPITLIAEIMGKHSNLILLDDQGTILDSIKRVTPSMSSLRTVLPGETYRTPPGQAKHDLLTADAEDITRWIADAPPARMAKTLVELFYGISPFTAEQICLRAGLDADAYAPFSLAQRNALAQTCVQIAQALQTLPLHSVQLYRQGRIDGFCPFPAIGYETVAVPTLNEAVCQYYQARRISVDIQRAKASMQSALSGRLQKLYKRLQIQDDAIRKSEGLERYRQEGELILAYAYQLKRGMEKATLFDYNQEKEILITLDPTMTPSENAARRFKRYQKAKATFVAAQKQKASIEPEIAYLESVSLAIEQAEGKEEIDQIRAELVEQHILSSAQTRGKRMPTPQAKPLAFVSSEGIAMLAGRNNAQNDLVTTRLGRSTDTWLHAQGMPGSHVLIQAHPVPQQTLLEAAHIAAYFSRGKHSSNVPIDYTLIKHVHKPSGAKPGFVTYTAQKTIFITPDEALVKRLIRS